MRWLASLLTRPLSLHLACVGVAQAAVAAQSAPGTGRKRLVGYVVPAGADLEAARAHCRWAG